MMVSTLDFENKFVFSVIPRSHPSKAFPKQLHCRGGRDVSWPGRAGAEQGLCTAELPLQGQGKVRPGLHRALRRAQASVWWGRSQASFPDGSVCVACCVDFLWLLQQSITNTGPQAKEVYSLKVCRPEVQNAVLALLLEALGEHLFPFVFQPALLELGPCLASASAFVSTSPSLALTLLAPFLPRVQGSHLDNPG